MTWALLQDAASIDDSGNSTLTQVTTFAGAMTLGSLIVATVSFSAGAAGTISVSDTLGNVYTACGPVYSDSLNGQFLQTFCALNTGGTAAASVTATFSVAHNFRRMGIAEFSGNTDASPFDQSNGQVQASPGTGTDAVTSDTITPSQGGCLIYGWTTVTDASDPGTGQIAAGSAFQPTEGDDATPDIFMGEWFEQPVAAPVSATFTLTIDHRILTSVVSFLPMASDAPDVVRRSDRTSVPPQVRLG